MSPAQTSRQVSVALVQEVKPDCHCEYRDWARRAVEAASAFPGHMGTHFLAPPPGKNRYEVSIRFATLEDAERWLDSPERETLRSEAEAFVLCTDDLTIRSGIDSWFSGATLDHRPPRRWKQWLVSTSILWPLTLATPRILRPVIDASAWLQHPLVAQLLVVSLTVFLVVYVVMPPYARLLSRWLSR